MLACMFVFRGGGVGVGVADPSIPPLQIISRHLLLLSALRTVALPYRAESCGNERKANASVADFFSSGEWADNVGRPLKQ